MFFLCIQVHRTRSGRGEPRQDKDTNIFLLLFISQFGEWIFFFETFFMWLRAMVLPRPGLSRSGDGRAVRRRQRGFRLVGFERRYAGLLFTFPAECDSAEQFGYPWSRSSVALPLGINGHPQGVLLPASTLLFCLTLAAEACGAHSNVSCGPPRRAAGVLPIRLL